MTKTEQEPSPRKQNSPSGGRKREPLSNEQLLRLLKRGGQVAGIVLVIYLAGFLHGRSQVGQVRRDFAARMESADSAIGVWQQDLAAAEARGQLQETVLWLFRGNRELERHNFGTAADYVARASAAFRQVPPEQSGASSAELLAIASSIDEIDLGVSPDVSLQRDRILKVILRVEALLNRN
jgi:hypothetical protein